MGSVYVTTTSHPDVPINTVSYGVQESGRDESQFGLLVSSRGIHSYSCVVWGTYRLDSERAVFMRLVGQGALRRIVMMQAGHM